MRDILADAGARLDGLRLLDGGPVLKAERCGAAVQCRIDGGELPLTAYAVRRKA